MIIKKLVAAAVLASAAFAPAAHSQELTFSFASFGNLITFDPVDTPDYIDPVTGNALPSFGKVIFPFAVGTPNFRIDSSSDASLIGLTGNIDTAGFHIGAAVCSGPFCSAPVGGVGTFEIRSTVAGSQGTLKAAVIFQDINSLGSSVTLPSTAPVFNIGLFEYTKASASEGILPGLQRILDSETQSDNPFITLSTTFAPPRSLVQLLQVAQTPTSSTFSGSFYSAAPIPEPSTYAMLAVGLGMVGFSLARARRS